MKFHHACRFFLCVWLCLPLAASAQHKEVDGTPIDDAVYRSFYSNFRKYARFACEVDGGYGLIPGYDRRDESSLGLSVNEVLEENSEEYQVRSGNLVATRTKSPPREDAIAYVRALPDMHVGSYGWLASAEVVHVIDDNTMLIKDLWLIDRDTLREEYTAEQEKMARRNDGKVDHDELKFNYVARIKLRERQEDSGEGFTAVHRLVGYKTIGLKPGTRWKGPNSEGFQVGVIRWETPPPDEFKDEDEATRRRIGRSSKQRLVLSEVEQTMRQSVDEDGFKKLLKERGMTVAGFVEMIRHLREEDRRNAEERIINALKPEDPLADD